MILILTLTESVSIFFIYLPQLGSGADNIKYLHIKDIRAAKRNNMFKTQYTYLQYNKTYFPSAQWDTASPASHKFVHMLIYIGHTQYYIFPGRLKGTLTTIHKISMYYNVYMHDRYFFIFLCHRLYTKWVRNIFGQRFQNHLKS